MATFLGASRDFWKQRGIFEKKNARCFATTRASWLLWGREALVDGAVCQL
jgi:hypothetical protein